MDTIDHIVNKVRHDGFAFINEWNPPLSTEQVAAQLGPVVEIEKHLPRSGIGKVQKLRPREASEELINQYSGIYGLNEFPFHSDLAHWHMPPHYLMLRCIRGSKDVITNLLPLSSFEDKIGKSAIKFALVAPRRKSKLQTICPLPVRFKKSGDHGVRWDLLFLQLLNDSAREVYRSMSSISWGGNEIIPACLENAGDTLIIDNWKMLHNRSPVPDASMYREIERVYLNRIG